MVDRDENAQTRATGQRNKKNVMSTDPRAHTASGHPAITEQESVPGITPSEFMGGHGDG